MPLKAGQILMHLRSQLGRVYRSCLRETVSWMRLAGHPDDASITPSTVRRSPKTGGRVVIRNQLQRLEIVHGLHCYRLSIATSWEEGQTLICFKNLESLGDQTVVAPPPLLGASMRSSTERTTVTIRLLLAGNAIRALGVVRLCYPDTVFVED